MTVYPHIVSLYLIKSHCTFIVVFVDKDRAGRAKENRPGGSLKYLLPVRIVYFKICIFKCSYQFKDTDLWM